MRPADQPYLSLVVAARYDNHGGSFMRRMQAFLNAFIEQCRRHRLPAEIVVAEWNPLPDRCGLAQALEWPVEMDWCRLRFIEVPAEIHAKYEHGSKIALYQMIAKNAAIRRSCGEFVLATNIDIFFNEPLMQFFAERRLERGKMYRIDRYDSGDAFPLWGSVEEQLTYCEKNPLRINAVEGTFSLNGKGRRSWPGRDIYSAEDEIELGEKWFPPEMPFKRPLRHADDGAQIFVPPIDEENVLEISLEPGLGTTGEVMLRMEWADGTVAFEHELTDRRQFQIPLSPSRETRELRLRVEARRKVTERDWRRLFICVWDIQLQRPLRGSIEQRKTENGLLRRSEELSLAAAAALWTRRKAPGLHTAIAPLYRRMTGRPVYSSNGVMHTVPRGPNGSEWLRPPAPLHTNACGDFTLMHRDHWMDVRGYAEFDAYSMNIDSMLCWTAHYAGYREEMLRDPMRIYHMEHDQGSGWTPEGSSILYKRIKESGMPWVEHEEVMWWATAMSEWKAPLIFNRGNWGLNEAALRERAPDLGPESDALRWCKDDAGSPPHVKARAEALYRLRALEPYPGWKFDAEWESEAPEIRERRKIWEQCSGGGWKLGVKVPWHEGTSLELDMRSEISRQIFVSGCYEPNEFYWLSQALRAGMTFFDIGANAGLFTLFAAARVGMTGRVVAVEPSAREYRALQRHIELNQLDWVTTRQIALGQHSGTGQLRVATSGRSGLNSLSDFGLADAPVDHREDVTVATLDQLVGELGVERLDVLKIDIEGAEAGMLCGGRKTIEQFRPWMLIEASERSLAQFGSSVCALTGLVRGFGYELLRMDPRTGSPTPWEGESMTESENLICRPLGRN